MAPSSRRIQLGILLKTLLGTENVYFQPKEGQNLQYPAIVYSNDNVRTDFANNTPYKINDRYDVTYIDRSPDSDIPRAIQSLPMSRFTSSYVMDGLNHYKHTLYF